MNTNTPHSANLKAGSRLPFVSANTLEKKYINKFESESEFLNFPL